GIFRGALMIIYPKLQFFYELKGGIDPAGADEHWKTAKTAIDRIVSAFKKRKQNGY
ncbi:MAG TPA: hypothetical protein DCO75_01135, partial [Fibrobacteres bacterium]|nr:hypothetical protein [Fibrobacterota bacterium]